MVRHWLIKSEPSDYSIDDLARDGSTHWDGVRSYPARNLMRNHMKVGDRVLFYHSNARPPAVVGIAEVAREAYPDPTQFDPAGPHFDPKSDPEAPSWVMVDVRYVATLPRPVGLPELKGYPQLAGMVLIHRPRLSVQPVTAEEFAFVVARAGEPAPG